MRRALGCRSHDRSPTALPVCSANSASWSICSAAAALEIACAYIWNTVIDDDRITASTSRGAPSSTSTAACVGCVDGTPEVEQFDGGVVPDPASVRWRVASCETGGEGVQGSFVLTGEKSLEAEVQVRRGSCDGARGGPPFDRTSCPERRFGFEGPATVEVDVSEQSVDVVDRVVSIAQLTAARMLGHSRRKRRTPSIQSLLIAYAFAAATTSTTRSRCRLRALAR